MTSIVTGYFSLRYGVGEILTFDTLGEAGATDMDVVVGAFTGVEGLPTTMASEQDVEAFGLAMLVKTSEVNDAGISATNQYARKFLGIGGGGDDVFSAISLGGATVYGRDGDDRIGIQGDANHSLNGGDGDDWLHVSRGDSTLLGGAGDDTLVSGAGGETLMGGAGLDTVDYQTAGAAVEVNLLDPNPQYTGAASGIDLLSGFEALKGSDHDDRLFGDGKDNRIEGRDGDDSLWGGDGADTLVGGAGHDRLGGGAGGDLISYADAAVGLTADLKDQTVESKGGPDSDHDDISDIEGILGSALADDLAGDFGRNTLLGGDGDDVIAGRGDSDVLDGGFGDDTIDGSIGDDVISGAEGADLISSGKGDDTVLGGAGRDTADYRLATAGVKVKLSTVGGQQTGGDGVDDLDGIESLLGSAFRDVLTGDAEDNRLDGRGGQDGLAGRFGADTLIGGAGKDLLTGGEGGDVMSGGVGKDRYVYASVSESWKVDVDLINDLTGEDRILLTAIDANTRKAGDQAFDLVGALTGKAGEAALVYDAASDRTRLLLDTDGDAKADGAILLAGDHTGFTNFAL